MPRVKAQGGSGSAFLTYEDRGKAVQPAAAPPSTHPFLDENAGFRMPEIGRQVSARRCLSSAV